MRHEAPRLSGPTQPSPSIAMDFAARQARRDEAIALGRQQKHSDALPLLLALLREEPLDWELLFVAGHAFLATDKPARAREHFDRALAVRPESTATMVLLGLTLGKLREPGLARDVFSRAAILNPDEDQAFLGPALVQRDLGELEKALAKLDSAGKAIARKLARHVGRTNDRSNRIYKHRSLGSELWVEEALFGAMFLCAEDDIDNMSRIRTARRPRLRNGPNGMAVYISWIALQPRATFFEIGPTPLDSSCPTTSIVFGSGYSRIRRARIWQSASAREQYYVALVARRRHLPTRWKRRRFAALNERASALVPRASPSSAPTSYTSLDAVYRHPLPFCAEGQHHTP